jgi:hypothetical protein
MLTSPQTVASHRDGVAPFGASRRRPADHAAVASQSAAVRRRWIVGLRQRVSLHFSTQRRPRRTYPPPRPSYIERAALAHEVQRP